MICILAYSKRRYVYESMRASYNNVRPVGSPEVPPFEEWREMYDICDHPHCRYEFRVRSCFQLNHNLTASTSSRGACCVLSTQRMPCSYSSDCSLRAPQRVLRNAATRSQGYPDATVWQASFVLNGLVAGRRVRSTCLFDCPVSGSFVERTTN